MSAVSKGLAFELLTVEFLQKHGLKAWRTNKTNPHDPDNYKHGFDGGVDIIATFDIKGKFPRHYDFYIQCKCHNKDLTKSAISEVYAGMHVRHAVEGCSVPVVIAIGNASEETRQFARELGVELILDREMDIVKGAKKEKKVSYASYGILLKALLYHCTNDNVWVQLMPETKDRINEITTTEMLLNHTMSDFDCAQSYLDRASTFARRAQEEQQRALDIQKIAAYRVLEVAINMEKQKGKTSKNDKPTIDMDSG